ncbi:MAG: hypothetical protein UHG68_00175, partial [Clostridia bacterium]|nr:hypothetical protein [Clostridia bacterium]
FNAVLYNKEENGPILTDSFSNVDVFRHENLAESLSHKIKISVRQKRRISKKHRANALLCAFCCPFGHLAFDTAVST